MNRLLTKYLSSISVAILIALSLPGIAARVEIEHPVVPVISGLRHSPTALIKVVRDGAKRESVKSMTLSLAGSSDLSDICEIAVYGGKMPSPIQEMECLAVAPVNGCDRKKLKFDFPLANDTSFLCIGLTLRDSVDLLHRICVACENVTIDGKRLQLEKKSAPELRIGKSLHIKGEAGVDTYRIPGLATAPDGSLIAIFDARYDSKRDLQGNIDIAMRRSCDGGISWSPMQRVLDMGEWGGLPEKFNGVSDACIISDKNTGRLFVAGLWMHGALDADGKWIEGLDDSSDYWIHQWKGKGSQPGLGVKETCQFLITHSDDNGSTWSAPQNITTDTKRTEWWLYAPAPGQGLTLSDGTLVFPTQGRDSIGTPFSNITYSRDGGKTWTASNPAYSNVTECNAVELNDGSVMLNMRDNRNRGHKSPNGRRICTTSDLGSTWEEHPTSRSALTEPTCMASLYRHDYSLGDGSQKSILLFANPNNYKKRIDMTLKVSFDDGATWPEDSRILFDETKGMGYSSITSVDDNTIGILYESGLADLVFLKISLDEIKNAH